MLNIWSIIFNFLWVFGLSVLLATWSYAYYQAHLQKRNVRDILDELGYALTLDAGLLIFIAGLASTEDRWWARLLWVILGLVVLVEAGMRLRNQTSGGEEGNEKQVDG